jgi:phosphoglucosamine mutase
VRLQPGQDWKNYTALQESIRQVESELGDRGRVLIRASGTEPLVRVMVEANEARLADDCAHRLADMVRAVPAH